MARENSSNDWIILAGLAAVGYLLYENGTLASWFPSIFGTSTSTTVPISAPTTITPVVAATGGSGSQIPVSTPSAPPPAPPPMYSPTVLTVADAAVFPYSSSITAAQMNSVHDALVTELQGGQIPQISGNSVLAYMLGWGGASAGQTQTVVGDSYTFDGSNWNLTSSSGLTGLGRIPASMIHRSNGFRIRRAA